MDSKFAYLLPAGQAVSGYLTQPGRGTAPQPHRLPSERPRGLAQVRRLAQAVQERSHLQPGDRFEPHGLGGKQLAQLQRQLSCYGLSAAHLVKKSLRLFPEQPLYVLLVEPLTSPPPRGQQPRPQVDSSLGTQIAQELNIQPELLVCLSDSLDPQLEQLIRAVPRSALSLSSPCLSRQ